VSFEQLESDFRIRVLNRDQPRQNKRRSNGIAPTESRPGDLGSSAVTRAAAQSAIIRKDLRA